VRCTRSCRPLPHRGSGVHPSSSLVVAAVLLTAFVGYVDYLTGREVRVFPLYFVPAGLAAWRVGRGAGIFISALAVTVWEYAGWLTGVRHSSPLVDIWNVVVQFGSLFAFSQLLCSLQDALERERTISRIDVVTDLPNRRAFFERLGVEIRRARRHGRPLTMAYMDLDNFKKVNDVFGHRHGDLVLRSFAEVLRARCRAGDTVARLGGDEFAVLLPETDVADARGILERIRAHAAKELGSLPVPVGVSIGAVTCSDADTADEIVRFADEIMYSVKGAGKGQVKVVSVAAALPRAVPT
jgi:diguanylate cyclase (GGDEF)-like protein